MNTQELNISKELEKAISKVKYYSVENFINDATDYINAIKERRMLCVIHSVSNSGISRNLSFSSCEQSKDGKFYYRNYNCLFLALGYKYAKNNGFKINGCGMDMIFSTNYNNIHDFERIGLITNEECKVLAQQTPVNLS